MGAPQLRTQNAGWFRFDVGAFECTSLWDGYIHHGYEGIYPNADPQEIARLKERHRLPVDHIPMDLNPVVVNTGTRLYLIDAGMGTTSKMFGDGMGLLQQNLTAAGLDPADIDAVLLTHLHPDHSFGLIAADGSAVFPNAALYVTRTDWAEWTDEANLRCNDHRASWTEGTLNAVAPYRDRLHLFEAGDRIAPEIATVSVSGHSLGQCAFVFESDGQAVALTGDVAHHQIYDPLHPEWFFHMDYDSDPAKGAAAKADIFAYLTDRKIRFHGYHFPFPGLGDLERSGDGTFVFHTQMPNPRL